MGFGDELVKFYQRKNKKKSQEEEADGGGENRPDENAAAASQTDDDTSTFFQSVKSGYSRNRKIFQIILIPLITSIIPIIFQNQVFTQTINRERESVIILPDLNII
jgi:hypothetical protein